MGVGELGTTTSKAKVSPVTETKAKPTKAKAIKIAGMMDGLTPMEIARAKKSGLDALF